MAIFLLHQILSYNFALCLTFVLFAGILCCRLIFCNCWRFTEPSVLSFLTVNVYQGCPEAPRRRKMCHGNFRGRVKKLERAKLTFLFQGNISALNRLDSQINVSKMLYFDLHTAKTIVTSIVHSKLDYCNSLYYVGLPEYQNIVSNTSRILLSNCCPVSKIPTHITPILKSLHLLKVSERIEYKIISLTYKILNTTQPPYLYDLVSI